MPITQSKNIGQSDFDKTVWRYLTFPKYVSLLTYGALWFSKLNILTDKYEGTMPKIVDTEMLHEHRKMKEFVHETLHGQLDDANNRNVEDGRELIIVNCWFLSEGECERMWKEYGGSLDALAIKSSIGRLSEYVYCDPKLTMLGKVQYVDLDAHIMSAYEANQAHERAFLKAREFGNEQEVRIATMSIKGPMCVNMNGAPLKPEEYQGSNMNNFENPGLYIRADLPRLINSIVLAPGASIWFELLVKRLVQLFKIDSPVERSSLEQ